jgi:hypothetical protein
LTRQEIARQALVDFAKVEELDFVAVPGNGMLDERDQLGIGHPRIGMEAMGVGPFLRHDQIQRHFHVFECARGIVPRQREAFVVIRHAEWQFPDPADDIGIRIIRHEIHEAIPEILGEPRAPL